MSLNKTLDRLFNEIRREARRNPEFADRLDAVLRAHASLRDVPDDVIEDVVSQQDETRPSPAGGGIGVGVQHRARSSDRPLPPPQGEGARSSSAGGARNKPKIAMPPAKVEVPPLNPVGLFQREGAEALETALSKFDRAALMALVREHNLDPSGEAMSLDRDALAAHVISAAAARVERDKKLFDY